MKINKDDPLETGLYLVYVDYPYTSNFADKRLLLWHDGYWMHKSSDQLYRGEVYGWIGPIPAMKFSENDKLSVKYAIAFRPDGEHGAFIDGPFDSLYEALEVIGEKGHYIYELHLDQESVPIRKWSDKKMKWLKRKKDD